MVVLYMGIPEKYMRLVTTACYHRFPKSSVSLPYHSSSDVVYHRKMSK